MRDDVNLLRYFVFETVIDASERFRAKRKSNLSDKIHGLAIDVQSSFDAQSSQEKMINSAIEDVFNMPGDALGGDKRVMMMLAPIYKHSWEGSDANLFAIIDLADFFDEQEVKVLNAFVKKHEDTLSATINEMKDSLDEIEEWANSMDWPAPWKRYTKWYSSMRSFQSFVGNFQKLLKIPVS